MKAGSKVVITCHGPFACVVGELVKPTSNGGWWVKVDALEWPITVPRVFTDSERADWMFFYADELIAE